MSKSDRRELWQLKTGLASLTLTLQEGVDHLDTLTGKSIARVLGELIQETVNLPEEATAEEIAALVQEIVLGTGELQEELAERWAQELAPDMARAEARAASLGHELAGFTCLAVDGQKWGAICIKCLAWVFVTPAGASGALLSECRGWQAGWKAGE